ncbi:MAG: acyl-ACP--UDP-N-acetylglucosamine O-acyltransferase [Deltaproteobacteria bacterium]|nr:acyl-ACP--UDP-N-acetylglucosamine O-acyltransferase [Deltaproteobacteria bacterium]
MGIHPTAIISPDAKIDPSASIGAYSVIGESVTIGGGTTIGSHVVVESHTDIGTNCRISQFASLGGLPQDLKYEGEETRVIIGNNNVIREFATINRATKADIGMTFIGNNNLIMAYCHIAHNCKLGNNIVVSNSAALAGHVHVDDYAIIGGLSGIHQFTKIGAYSFIGGASAVTRDVPPFVLVSGNTAKAYGLNVVGLQRRGFSEETIGILKSAYRLVYRSSLAVADAIREINRELPDIEEVRVFVDFVRNSERGICR